MAFKYIITVLIIIVFGGNVNAQDFIVAFDSTATPEVAVGEVIISRSKDNLRLKEMPASVTILPASFIKDNEIRNLTEVTSAVPNFFMPDYGSKLTAPVYVRGIGSRIDAPSVGLYIDNVPFFEKASFNTDFFDIQSVEVLRGPQGTLYGRNTMGGIVNITTLSPFDFQGTNIKLSAGSHGSYNIAAGHYGLTRGNFGYSLSLNYLHNDGYYTNFYDTTSVDRLNSAGLRNRLLWKPTAGISIENIASVEIADQGGYPYAVLNSTTGEPDPINYNDYSSYSRNLASDAFIVRHNRKNIEMIATTAYQFLNDNQGIDQDFTQAEQYFVTQRQTQNMLSQEVSAKSSIKKPYGWLSGIYGFVQLFDKEVDVETFSTSSVSYKSYDHRIAGLALYHQSSLNDFLFNGLTITGGIRVDYEKDILYYKYDVFRNSALTAMADTTYPALTSLELQPKVSVSYAFGKNNLYAVVARGYKTGGFNSTFERPEDLTFDPEHSWNYEAGFKTTLPGNLFADISVFYIDWRNQQIYQTVQPSGRGSLLKNAGHSASKGAEFTLKANPLKGLDISASYGFTHAVFLIHVVNDTTDYSGNFIPYVPKHTATLQTTKTLLVRNSRLLDRIRINAAGKGTGDIYWNEKNDHSQSFYVILDAKISFIRGDVQFDIWGKNITGTRYEAFYFTALNRKYVQLGKPARAGINLYIKF